MAAVLSSSSALAGAAVPVPVSSNALPMAPGPYQPSWDSLASQYTAPDWYRDAKFGIWAHWSAQCVPEHGDWYARKMYIEGDETQKFHIEHYGDPKTFGFKEFDHAWKAENWKPDELMALYKRAGAQFFVALANHHDNFDCYDSKYQPWNSTKIGPMKDIVGIWEQSARKAGLRFGVSVHASHTWTWFEPAQAYDGKLTAADGKGTWWEGLDPQDLYCQNHVARGLDWDWNPEKCTLPDQAYVDKFYNRTIDLIDKYQPDLIYFDDTRLPLDGVSDAGLRITAHAYNQSAAKHGKAEVVVLGKILDEKQRRAIVWDIERGHTDVLEPIPWQTDTCIGSWHYDRRIFEKHGYKTSEQVIRTLADIVSKNGNLQLSVPVRGDGSIDEDEIAFLNELAAWMDVNRECIFGTRPWTIYGEGPAVESAAEKKAGGANFNERGAHPLDEKEIRFTTRGDVLYAIVLGWPSDQTVTIKALATDSALFPATLGSVTLLGASGAIAIDRRADGLHLTLPQKPQNTQAIVLRIERKR